MLAWHLGVHVHAPCQAMHDVHMHKYHHHSSTHPSQLCSRRIVEIAVGWKHVPNKDETYFFTLDSLPIYLAFLTYAILFMPWHFQRVETAPPKDVELASEVAQREQQGPQGMQDLPL